MDEIKNNAALEAEDQEESLILNFRRPYQFEGQEYTELDLSGLLAARVTGKPLEFFQRLPGRDAIALKSKIVGFLYGGDGNN